MFEKALVKWIRMCTDSLHSAFQGNSILYAWVEPERAHRGHHVVLRCFCNRRPISWDLWLPPLNNSAPHLECFRESSVMLETVGDEPTLNPTVCAVIRNL